MRQGLAVVAIVLGLALLVTPFAYSMFGRTADAERILERFEFLTLGDNPSRYLAEAKTTRAGSAELVETAIPRLSSAVGVTSAELDRLSETRFSALGAGAKEIPQANEFSIRYSRQLEAVDEKFKSVYDIPVSGLSLTATPWLLLLTGLTCVVAGAVALRRGGRAPIATILALGSVMVVAPLVLSAPAKSADGEDVKDFASRGLSPKAAAAAREASDALNALVAETREEIVPHLARRQGVSAARLNSRLREQSPDAGRFSDEWDVIGPRLARLSNAVSDSVAEFKSAKGLPISFPVWLLLGGGATMTVLAGVALAAGRAKQDA